MDHIKNNKDFKKFILLLLPALLSIALIYLPTWEWMYGRWTAEDSYSSHGFLIPLISAWILWQDRYKIKDMKIQGTWWGFAFLLFGLFAHTLSGITRVHFTSGFSLIFVLYGLVLMTVGWEGFRWSWFSIFYLFFMLPFPSFWESQFTLELKLMASEASMRIMDFMGYIVVREGSIIFFSHPVKGTEKLIVGDVCSGLRSLISLLALGVPFVYFIRASWWRKGLMLASLFPVAFFCNVARILLLGLVTYHWGAEMASGFIHDASGILIFVGDLMLLWGIYVLLREEETLEIGTPSGVQSFFDFKTIQVFKPFWLKYFLGNLSMIFVTVISLLYLYKDLPVENISYTQSIPEHIGQWSVAQAFEVDRRTVQLLETNDIMMRYYRKGNSAPVLLSIVASAQSNRKIAHPPEICYRGIGWEVMKREKIRYNDGKEGIFMIIFTGKTKEAVLYWYKFEDVYTAEYYYHQAGALFNLFRKRKGGVALIRMSTTILNSTEESLNLMMEFSKDLYPYLDKYLP
ncbi:MAG: EpsI family protein [Candidatus Brocadiae bacterium]|nr:EpsI family protein [Candidatus Brocadiia bacterium]